MDNHGRVDHIITGLGLSGAAIALQLIQSGKRVAVFNNPVNNRSSHVAAGLFNPITGKVMVKTWKADELFPYLIEFYQLAERITSRQFFKLQPIYIPFRSIEEQNDWTARSEELGIKGFVERVFTSSTYEHVVDELGGVQLSRCGYVNVLSYLQAVRDLIQKDHELFGEMDYAKLNVNRDFVEYEGIRAESLVLCDGLHARNNPLTSWLPIKPLKGETLDVRLPVELPVICNRGVYAVPLGNRQYRVGSTFERSEAPGISPTGRADLENRLRSLLKLPFEVTSQNWGIRPTVGDRRPIIGRHPQHANVFIFNGMGTKAVSQAPYFSKVLTGAIFGGSQIGPEVNISRFYALSSKSRD